MTSRGSVLIVVLLLLGTVPAGVVGASGAAPASEPAADAATLESADDSAIADTAALESTAVSTADAETDAKATALADADDILHRTIELRHLPDRPDVYEAEFTFDVPEPMSSLTVDLEAEADVRALEGFEETAEGTYRWTGDVDEPTIRATLPADRTSIADHAGASEGEYSFVDTGEWGVVPVPGVGVTYQKSASVEIGIAETVTVDGPGATGGDMAFFGPVTEYERTVDGETIRLVVPDAADLREDPDAILETLAGASERLSIAPSAAEVFVVAVPSGADWGSRGLQYGESDAWVVADAPLEEASNVWLHEYVHVHQRFANGDVATDAAWLVEGGAEYHAALLAYEQELISFGEYRDHLERGEESPYADGTLAKPGTWNHERTDYVKGPLVYGELDRRLRLATDGDRRLEDVMPELNADDGQVTATDFLAALEDAGGEDVRNAAERYVHTAATPDAWNRFDHGDAFDQPRPAIATGLGDASIAVDDREWERWSRDELTGPGAAIGAGDVLAVPAGDRVSVPVALANDGDREGTADATLQVDGETVDYDPHALAGGETATTTLTWTPSDPGIYDVRVGSDRLTVYVRSTPSLDVTDLEAEPDGIEPGESVTATATVTTADALPAAGRLEFRTAEETERSGPVALTSGDTERVDAELTFEETAEHEISVGDRTTTVSVGGLQSEIESLPGFGVAAAAVALAVALATLGRRRR